MKNDSIPDAENEEQVKAKNIFNLNWRNCTKLSKVGWPRSNSEGRLLSNSVVDFFIKHFASWEKVRKLHHYFLHCIISVLNRCSMKENSGEIERVKVKKIKDKKLVVEGNVLYVCWISLVYYLALNIICVKEQIVYLLQWLNIHIMRFWQNLSRTLNFP